ncbi:alcohol oxidase [Gymnopus androsaceus JB14]|uniref:Alcohol oxidase n=1 Tax=Gymnopus androsaceus JB14 TaxID=1447944 RepID=A0A6A4HJC3_9AGAR|nr:alcohol oxidase [Gymnopus androsaceus JB14]
MLLLKSYDVVFAGGGTTACIVAGRLAQADPSLKILIIEAGSHTQELHDHVQPGRYLSNLGQGRTFSHHNSVPSEALGGRSIHAPTGCCLGGGSSVNFMAYTRANASDYDDWEKTGNPGWGSRDLIPLARKVETYQVASGDPAVHGFTGPIKISHGGHDTNIGREFLEVAAQYNQDRQTVTSSAMDANDFHTVDVYAPWHKYIDSHSGKRSDTAHFIYSLNAESKRNVNILTNRRVVKVLFENNRAVGVEHAAHSDFDVAETKIPAQAAYASRLVVLSSGAFGSPAILERSGIGSADHLAKAHVDQLLNLPGVGENYNDHILCTTPYLSSEDSDCLDGIFSGHEEVIEPYLMEWTEKGTGLLAHNSIDSAVKLRPTSKELEELGPSFKQLWQEFYAGAPDKPVAMMIFAAANLSLTPSPPGSKTFSVTICTMYSRAIGYTHITSGTNPWAPLRFNPRFLEDPIDIAILRWCYKRGRELARRIRSFQRGNPAGNPKFLPTATTSSDAKLDASAASVVPSAPGPVNIDAPDIAYSAEDDKAIDNHHRAKGENTLLLLGTCAMKPRAAGGVVDPRLNVYGVDNLKVADLSIVPLNVSAATYNTALIVGEKAFLIIAEDLGISTSADSIVPRFLVSSN